MIPWWAYLYLGVLGLLTLAGIIEEMKKPGGIVYASGTFLTLVIIIIFVTGFFIQEVGELIGIFSLPLLVIALVYDFVLSGRNLVPGSPNFWQPLDEVKSRMDSLTATLIVAPGYLAGLAVFYRSVS